MAVYRRKDTKSKRWFYKFEVDGVTYKKGIPTARTKPQALEAERQARQDVHDGCYQSRRANMPFVEFVEKVYLAWAEQNHRPTTRDKTMAVSFCAHFKSHSIRQMSVMAIEGYKQKRAKQNTQYGTPFKASTINLELDTLSGILTLAVKHGFLRENPCWKVARLETPEEPCRYLLPEEEAALMEQAGGERPFLKPLIQVALLTGFRQCELIALRKRSVDFSRNRIFVVNPKWKKDPRRTKGNPMGADTSEILFRLASKVEGEYFFVNDHTGEALTRGVIDTVFRRACAKAGVDDFRFHSLRHTFGTRLGDADVSLEKIARLMGHSNIKMTMRYVHPTDDGLQRALEHAKSTRIVPGAFVEVREHERKTLQATG
jgi:integrase